MTHNLCWHILYADIVQATNEAGSIVSTVTKSGGGVINSVTSKAKSAANSATSKAGSATSNGAAAATGAPMIVGGLLGAGMVAVAML